MSRRARSRAAGHIGKHHNGGAVFERLFVQLEIKHHLLRHFVDRRAILDEHIARDLRILPRGGVGRVRDDLLDDLVRNGFWLVLTDASSASDGLYRFHICFSFADGLNAMPIHGVSLAFIITEACAKIQWKNSRFCRFILLQARQRIFLAKSVGQTIGHAKRSKREIVNRIIGPSR